MARRCGAGSEAVCEKAGTEGDRGVGGGDARIPGSSRVRAMGNGAKSGVEDERRMMERRIVSSSWRMEDGRARQSRYSAGSCSSYEVDLRRLY